MENNIEIAREIERLRSVARQDSYVFQEIISICETVQTDSNKDLNGAIEEILKLVKN